MGRPPANPALQRYSVAGYGSALYVFEVSDGTVKVGQSSCVRRRLETLHTILRHQGKSVGRFQVFPADPHSICADERVCILALRRVARNVGMSREFFAGITFDDAAVLITSALQAVPA